VSVKVTLARIDTATALGCAYCGGPLADDRPDDMFRREACQTLWRRRHANTVYLEDAVESLRAVFERMAVALAEVFEQWSPGPGSR
jgi:hypothetical protein